MKNKKTQGQTNLYALTVVIIIVLLVAVAIGGFFVIREIIRQTEIVPGQVQPPAEQGPATGTPQANIIPPPSALDSDNDGIPDEVERIIGTDPNKADQKRATSTATTTPPAPSTLDSDNDGVPDDVERIIGTNPNVADQKKATATTTATTTTPSKPPAAPSTLDSDGDGVPDDVERIIGTDPYKKN